MESRTWYFTHRDSSKRNRLAVSLANTKPIPFYDQLDFGIMPPGTLVLRKVNDSYDGTYEFELGIKDQDDDTSTVRVFIASKVLSQSYYAIFSLEREIIIMT